MYIVTFKWPPDSTDSAVNLKGLLCKPFSGLHMAVFETLTANPTHKLLNVHFALQYSKGYFQSLLPLLEL